ncbi:sigma-70 family RNA polymerase sigma factor, partial [bacterium]|nr:sigma-70 family RNA polymerase sigma factor [bacterium]
MIEEWVKQCREGKTRAYAEVVRALRPRLLEFLYRMTQCRETAEELGQEAFLKAFQKIKQFNSQKSSFPTWIFQIARNLCIDHMRRQRMDFDREVDSEGIVSLHPTPRDSAADNEWGQRIASAVRGLDLPFREVFLLREYHQLEIEEIASITNTATGTVKSRLFRARHALQAALEPTLKQAGK